MSVSERWVFHYGGIIYRLRLGTIARTLQQDPELYADLVMYNDEVKERVKENLKQAEKLNDIIDKKNKKEFIEYFKEASDFYRGFGEEALKDSGFLIEQLSKLKHKEKK